jgi:lipopolysaccharide transport system ATP-binding protein
MKPIIRAESLSKQYRLGNRQAAYCTLRESLAGVVRAPVRFLKRSDRLEQTRIWALKEVSFEVLPGEVVGVIGRNGAGKSTLLKILSRITEPTEGRVDLYGRVGSLLEVGTGFHAELTGRDNIYLNGAILGMRKTEIERRFDEIVAFAEVEKFLDTPVKRYSSGMYVRLAFAVAAHLDTEILLIDEVLAVGDATFQKKCLGKMRDASIGGRTVFFISHNMPAIESLCSRCLLLDDGKLKSVGHPDAIISEYLNLNPDSSSGRRNLTSHPGRLRGSLRIMTEVSLLSETDEPLCLFRMGAPLSVQIGFSNQSTPVRPAVGVVIKNSHGIPVFGFNNRIVDAGRFCTPVPHGTVTCRFDSLPLMPGTYFVDLYFGDHYDASRDLDVIQEAVSFDVLPSDVLRTGKLPPEVAGSIFCPATFKMD